MDKPPCCACGEPAVRSFVGARQVLALSGVRYWVPADPPEHCCAMHSRRRHSLLYLDDGLPELYQQLEADQRRWEWEVLQVLQRLLITRSPA